MPRQKSSRRWRGKSETEIGERNRTMLELQNNRLVFSFPEVHPDAKCTIEFVRTLRLPDDGKTYPLPPGIGTFPLKHTDDFKSKVSEDTAKKGGVMLPMYQSEALWIRFSSNFVSNQGVYPFAVKIAAGKRSAITANAWVGALKDGDYVVVPTQPWIDGFVVSEGQVRQFVAAPLGMGFTVEEQLTQKAEFGGIQLEVYPMKREEFDKRFPKRPVYHTRRRGLMGANSFSKSADPVMDSFNFSDSLGEDEIGDIVPCAAGPAATNGSVMRGLGGGAAAAASVKSMGMAAGGSMKQEVYPDPYGLDVWDTSHKTRTFVHLMNSLSWEQVTGAKPPHAPPSARDYSARGLPWFEYYSDAGALGATSDTKKIKSVAQLSEEKGFTILPENESADPQKIAVIKAPKNPNAVVDGDW